LKEKKEEVEVFKNKSKTKATGHYYIVRNVKQ